MSSAADRSGELPHGWRFWLGERLKILDIVVMSLQETLDLLSHKLLPRIISLLVNKAAERIRD